MKAPQSVARSQLGARLKELRECAELSLTEAAQQAKTSTGSLSRVENGQRGLKQGTAERLLDCYGVADSAVRNEVLELIRVDAARRRRPSWWQRHREVLSPTHFDGYLALESSASVIRNYEPLLVPGLLQTREYAHEVISGMRPELRPRQIEQLVEIRMARQEKVLGSGGTDFSALIDEAALLRPVGSPAVMRSQLEWLISVSEKPTTDIRVSAFVLGPHPGLAGPFVIMSFPVATRDVVWVETMKRSLYFEEKEDAELYNELFENLWERALTPDETRLYFKQKIKELQQ
ncbi:helix-turn-helix domain-containing protein [Streptomyces mobaraensis]|uniref:Helix-turn-helix domain-containing protein n=2 Tax=Streptomyces mobaraensis TaxID=35621 RepID=A0A5N5W1B5_STRMB|nr:helix-turn-helix domain-containing protein [Streptomyces mobaraensis]